ncbi:MAG: hypothetical protein AMXMBFR13_06550 [Phycisphaerae bacterium]
MVAGLLQRANPGLENHAFRWSRETGIQILPQLESSFPLSMANALSGNGRVVGGVTNDDERMYATLWPEGEGPTLLSATQLREVADMTPDASTLLLTGGHTAIWTASGETRLGTLAGPDAFTCGTGISADGSTVTGYGQTASGIYGAFRWTPASGMTGLGTLNGAPTEGSVAYAISPDGTTIVGANLSSTGATAVRWRAESGIVSLDSEWDAIENTSANDTSQDGSVVVGRGYRQSPAGNIECPFYWSAQTGMVGLADYLVDVHHLDLTGWELINANAISPDGLTIVGEGIHNGVLEGFIAVLPEPMTLHCLAVACLPLLHRRRPTL